MGIQPEAIEYSDGPIGGEFAWRSEEIRDGAEWIHEVDDGDIAEIEAAVAATRAAGLDIMAITAKDFPLPRLSAKLAELRKDCVERFGFGFLRGLPVDRYDNETLIRLYWGLSRHLGDPVPQNRNGHLIGHVIDVGDRPGDLGRRLTQSTVELQCHSDSCDLLGLMCIQPAMQGGESTIVSAVTVHDEMLRRDPELCHALYQPVNEDRRGEIPEGMKPWAAIPVFMMQDGHFASYGPLDEYMESARRYPDAVPMSETQWAAIRLFREICNDPDIALRIAMQAGDLVYLHNPVVYHAREEYRDWPEENRKRHLMRIWLSMSDGPQLPEALAEKWIKVERGAERGGVHSAGRKAPNVPLDPATPAFR
ncbi:Taurine catabolism dioxygenase TauD, TfdA family [Enhydrobacter aerosaccus]|uniref:Taurine catabolism dioxygenase TauD, TfdA family n=1 Tax=Enhydrobacter aerosaccus TaxID=225324 RepID=A0A1T4P0D4_9HYPH|nr:TauD/TfdA family dioxygenase [Enhydrobacter aerosaccus]SJZ85060.1 Taurine catabolism dioxygenase TauD, TfdA family [Enhydrobacter aerosaccus]